MTSERTRRLLLLVPYLRTRPAVTVDDLAARFGTTPRQIEKDLDALNWCGMPGPVEPDYMDITYDEDGLVSVELADELREPLRLTDEEALQTVLAIEQFAVVFGDEFPALRSAVDKVRLAAGLQEGVVEGDDSDSPAVLDLLRRLRLAINEDRQVSLTYLTPGADDPTERVIDPWVLRHVGHWYVQGYCHLREDSRTFRLDRVVACTVIDRVRVVAAPEEIPEPRWAPGPEDVVVDVSVPASARWLLDRVDADEVEGTPDGGARIVFRAASPAWVAELLLSTGMPCEVHAPRALGDLVRADAEAALSRYR